MAVDHGFFNQPGFLQGIEDMREVIKVLVDAAPDAIQLTLGMARHLQEIQGRQKPSLVLRTDILSVWHLKPKALTSFMLLSFVVPMPLCRTRIGDRRNKMPNCLQ